MDMGDVHTVGETTKEDLTIFDTPKWTSKFLKDPPDLLSPQRSAAS